MQFFAFLACLLFCLTLELPPCESQSQAKLRHGANFGNQSRCDWQCAVVGSDFGKEMKKLITEYRLITLDLTFEQRVDENCLNQTQVHNQTDFHNQTHLYNRNQTSLHYQTDFYNQTDLHNQTHLHNATKPADVWIWLTDNFQSRGTNVSKLSIGESDSLTWFRKSLEGQTEVRVRCNASLTKDSALNDTRTTSLNDLIAMVIMKKVANSTGGFSYSGTNLCYKESAENGPFACLDVIKSRIPPSWSQRALGIISIPIAFVLWWYSPIILCLFSPTENGGRVIVLNGTSPVGIRSWISNFFSSKNTTGYNIMLTLDLVLLIFLCAILTLLYIAGQILDLPPSDSLFEFLQVIQFIQFVTEFMIFCGIVSFLFTLRNMLSFCCTKLSIENDRCLICEMVGDDFIDHRGFLKEVKRHLRLQPLIVLRCCTCCLDLCKEYFKLFYKFESYYVRFLVFVCATPITTIVLVALPFVVLPILITVYILYSCPLSSTCAMMFRTYRQYVDENRKCVRCCKILLYLIFTFVQFSLPVASFGIIVFVLTVLSLQIIRGILISLPDYLPYATLVVVVAFYCWKCYSSFSRKYYNLALKLYRHSTTNAQHEDVVKPREPKDETPLIPKDLFEKACEDLMPLRESISLLVVKLVSLLTFFFVVFVVIMETPDASDQAKATATFFTALVPKIIEIVLSKDPGMEELDNEILEKKLKCVVHKYRTDPENKNIVIQDVKEENAENSV